LLIFDLSEVLVDSEIRGWRIAEPMEALRDE